MHLRFVSHNSSEDCSISLVLVSKPLVHDIQVDHKVLRQIKNNGETTFGGRGRAAIKRGYMARLFVTHSEHGRR